jgi:hypothetical protein
MFHTKLLSVEAYVSLEWSLNHSYILGRSICGSIYNPHSERPKVVLTTGVTEFLKQIS